MQTDSDMRLLQKFKKKNVVLLKASIARLPWLSWHLITCFLNTVTNEYNC